ncbi:MAG: glycosyltransferase family 4 protein, partial [Myxococcales bacterium]|nr:glycosyltransferase family 4 protein [Myxococcales bacterium]
RAALFADVTGVLSEATHARFVAEGIDPSRVRRIAPCVPAGGVRASAPRDVLRRGFEWPTDAPVVVYPGDLEFGGGAERMIDALADMPKETVLVLACRPKTEAARAKESELRTLVEARGLAPRVRWMGETPRILDVLAAADVVALPSVNLYAKMDYPLVLLEAMALGVPVVVASHTPAAELARAGACLAVQGDPGAVAEGVSGLLGDDAARRALGERGQAHVQTHHSPGRMAQAYESLYEALLP